MDPPVPTDGNAAGSNTTLDGNGTVQGSSASRNVLPIVLASAVPVAAVGTLAMLVKVWVDKRRAHSVVAQLMSQGVEQPHMPNPNVTTTMPSRSMAVIVEEPDGFTK